MYQDQICKSKLCENKECSRHKDCLEGACKGGRCISECSLPKRPCRNRKSCKNHLCEKCEDHSDCDNGKVLKI